MDLIQISHQFKEACEAVNPNARFLSVTKTDIAQHNNNRQLTKELYTWYRHAAPRKVRIPWTVSELVFSDPLQILDEQVGYRWQHKINGLEIDDWSSHWLVIANIGGDPIIAHTAEELTPIYMAYHGLGAWNPQKIAPSLGHFLQFVTEWCYFMSQFAKFNMDNRIEKINDMFDDDSLLLPDVKKQLQAIIQKTVGDAHTESLMDFIGE